MSQAEFNGNGDPSQSRVMTLTEVAQVLKIGRSTAWELYRSGRLPFPVLQVGSQLRVVRAHFESYLATGLPVTTQLLEDLQ